MATFSNTPPAAAATSVAGNTLSTTSSLSYHHLLPTSNASNNHHNHHHHSSNSTSSEENLVQGTTINDINLNHTFDGSASYLTNSDFSLCLSGNQQVNPFDVVVSSSTSPSPFNSDPLVRHFFNYRQNETNLTGNYYSNVSTGSFVNAFDYPYANMTPTTLGAESAAPNHGFNSVNVPQHHPHSFMNSYMSYPHSQQQQQALLKPPDSFSVSLQQQQQQQQTQQQANQQQSIYPWMRRIHNTCGKINV